MESITRFFMIAASLIITAGLVFIAFRMADIGSETANHVMQEFADTLSAADMVVMTAIMGSRERNTYGITTQDLADRIPGSVWYETFQEVRDYILQTAKPGDLLLTLGCGDVYKLAHMILEKGNEA